jgi:HK97 family phage major capsid protein
VRKSFGGFAAEVETLDTGTARRWSTRAVDDTANLGGITAESAAITSGADLVFGTVTLGAYKYTSAGAGSNLPLRVPVELLQDSAFDVESLVARKLGERIARAQAAHWVTGTGVGSAARHPGVQPHLRTTTSTWPT